MIPETYMNLGVSQRGLGGRQTPRGSSHRTSFIEYVSEAYNRRNVENSGGSQASGNHLDALSARGHSISSGSVASGISSNSLARDFSVRSENVTANRMLSFKIGSKHVGKGGLQRDTTKSARLAAG